MVVKAAVAKVIFGTGEFVVVNVPPKVPQATEVTDGVVTVRPVGSKSVKVTPLRGDEMSVLGFMSVNLSSDDCPIFIVCGLKTLVSVGGAITVRLSLAVTGAVSFAVMLALLRRFPAI